MIDSAQCVVDTQFEDHPREACGIFGVHGHHEAAKMCYFGLYALQHRGQESAGIAVAKNDMYLFQGFLGIGFHADPTRWITRWFCICTSGCRWSQ